MKFVCISHDIIITNNDIIITTKIINVIFLHLVILGYTIRATRLTHFYHALTYVTNRVIRVSWFLKYQIGNRSMSVNNKSRSTPETAKNPSNDCHFETNGK